MGTLDGFGFSHFVLGSVTEENLKLSKITILIIHGK